MPRGSNSPLAIAAALFLAASAAEAKTVALLSDCEGDAGHPVENYSALVKAIVPGDILRWCGERRFTVKSVVHRSPFSMTVLEIEENADAVLRLNSSMSYRPVSGFGINVVPATALPDLLEGEAALAERGFARYRILEEDPHGFWALQEKIVGDYVYFSDFLKGKLPPGIAYPEAALALVGFAKEHADVTYVQDLHERNFVFSAAARKWKAVDWMATVSGVDAPEQFRKIAGSPGLEHTVFDLLFSAFEKNNRLYLATVGRRTRADIARLKVVLGAAIQRERKTRLCGGIAREAPKSHHP